MRRRIALATAAFGLAVSAGGAAPAQVTRTLSDVDAVTTGSTYAFSTSFSGNPVRWDPCTAIHWRYRAAGQVPGGFTQIQRAVARVAKATGTTWVYDGTSTAVPTTAWLPKRADQRPPVLIGWTTAEHSDLLRGQSPGVLGVTRTAWFGVERDGTTTAAIRGAVVALNQSKRLPLTGSVSWYATALHELSHAMGLSHATSARELMYPVLQPGLTDLQPGDLAGLSKVGRARGCITLPF